MLIKPLTVDYFLVFIKFLHDKNTLPFNHIKYQTFKKFMNIYVQFLICIAKAEKACDKGT